MRTILTTCFLVLLLLWELNAATSLSPSTPSQHGGSAESHRSTSRSEGPTTLITSHDPTKELRPEHGELNDATFLSPSTPSQHGQSAESQRFSSKNGGPTILLRSDQPTTELRPQHGDSSSKKPTHFPTKQNLTDTSHSEHKTTEIQTTREENESPSSTFSLATSKVQTKRSLEYSTESQEPSTDKESTILATRDHNQHSTTGPVTDETVTTSVTMVGKTPTAAPTSSLTTQPTKKPTNKKILPVTPETQDQSNAKKNNTGPIVASLIGSALVLMFIAIAVILFRKRRMQKRQLDNPDWAGPSPFLDSDIHPNSSKQGDEELFPTKRDTKRISLHSFLPQRLSQRLSLLVEEDVQMNDMVVNSTFGKNENSQNGKPTVQQGEEQEQDQDQDKSQEQKLTEANTPDVVSLAPGAPETVDKPAAPVDNGTIQPTSTPAEEITSLPSPSTETNAALPTPPPFEDVDLSLPQTNPANTSPAPQT
uniref:Uncharacterized protein n=1 Tax=Astyanax mexicanus TaxID=7994 RepID=A0A3B1KLK4_ASTMX